jgi:protein-arginine kinase activator protein McsA
MMEKAKLADYKSGHHEMDDQEVLRLRKHIEALEQTLRREHEGHVDVHAKRREAMRSMLDSDKSKLAEHLNGKNVLEEDALKALRKKIDMLEHRLAHEHIDRERRERHRPDRGMEL